MLLTENLSFEQKFLSDQKDSEEPEYQKNEKRILKMRQTDKDSAAGSNILEHKAVLLEWKSDVKIEGLEVDGVGGWCDGAG